MERALRLHRDVEKQLQRIPKKTRERLVQTMRSLRVEPRPKGAEKLDDNLYRIRQGDYRVIYAVFDKETVIVICKVARRAESTYRDLRALLEKVFRFAVIEDDLLAARHDDDGFQRRAVAAIERRLRSLDLAHRASRGSLLDHEDAHPAVLGVRIGLGEHGVEVGDPRVGDPDLAPVQHVVIAGALRLRAHAEDVGARFRLGHAHAADPFAGHRLG